jgi:hypothetical protein
MVPTFCAIAAMPERLMQATQEKSGGFSKNTLPSIVMLIP